MKIYSASLFFRLSLRCRGLWIACVLARLILQDNILCLYIPVHICTRRIGCFLISMAILFIPVYTYELVMKNVPNALILLIGVLAVVIIIVLAPVESINKPLDEEERRYYARVTHCITALQVCVLIILFCLDLQDYFYAGYVSIVLVAVFMVMGKIAVKRYVQ